MGPACAETPLWNGLKFDRSFLVGAAILQRIGEQRSYRLRFRHPAMQPYVIMRGIQEGVVDERAKKALSSPEQGDLFPNAT